MIIDANLHIIRIVSPHEHRQAQGHWKVVKSWGPEVDPENGIANKATAPQPKSGRGPRQNGGGCMPNKVGNDDPSPTPRDMTTPPRVFINGCSI